MVRITRRRLMRAVASTCALSALGSPTAFAAHLSRAAATTSVRFPARPSTLSSSILAANRLVTYYGNPWSGAMGILGQLSKSELVKALQRRAVQYEAAGGKPTIPAIHMVVTTAQASPGDDGLYRARMPASIIQEYADLAASNGMLFIADVQVGRSTVADEVAAILPILREPHVHLALDPEFDMWGSQVPGVQLGHMTAAEINHAIGVMSGIASQTGRRKILIVHQFAASMLPDKGAIGSDPRLDMAIVMDGFGGQGIKIEHYNMYVRDSDFRFGGIKLFFDWDTPLMTASQALSLTPPPDVIIYQ
jgi:hypothetical protein